MRSPSSRRRRNRTISNRLPDEDDVALCPSSTRGTVRSVTYVQFCELLVMTRDELVVAFALTRIDHPTLDLEEVAALLVRRVGPRQALHLAAQNLATRDELRGDVFTAAVEHVLRTLLQLRDGSDD